jgi:pimeloyl-ACP methyl ester carboxylesterase
MTTLPMQQARLGEISLAHQQWGDGEPVLLVHGAFIADAMVPLAHEPAMAPYRRILYHRRGYGESPRPEPLRPASLADQADDASALLRLLDVDSADVVGHSGGALVALKLAAQEPTRVRSLTLLEPPTTFGRPPGAEWVDRILPLAETYGRGDVEGSVVGFYDSIYQAGWKDRMEQSRPGAFERSLRDAVVAFESDLPGTDWANGLGPDEVSSVRCPVLSVLGTRTLPLFSDARELLHDWFPWCEDADIPGGDHLLPVELPTETARAIAAFLAGHEND